VENRWRKGEGAVLKNNLGGTRRGGVGGKRIREGGGSEFLRSHHVR
jgi:hypothetical protein